MNAHTYTHTRTATIDTHSVAQNNTHALLGIGSACCALTPNVHSLPKELMECEGLVVMF